MQYKDNDSQVNQHNNSSNNNNNSHRYHPPQYSQNNNNNNNNCKTVAANSISTNDNIASNYNDPKNKNTCANYNSSQRTPSAGPNQLPPAIAATTASAGTMMMTKQKTSLSDRLNIGDEVRELKLGCTFNTKNTTTAFHTIKYDFKPASVDKSRVATVDVGSNSQVTVTVPNLESSGVPHTVYKGNQRKYTKECLIIYDRKTGDITLEKLSHNIQVKKTRSEVISKPTVAAMPVAGNSNSNSGPPPSKLENSTMRISSKTKVSTGSRRNNIIDFKPRNSPMQGSPSSSATTNHRSPQSAPAWNANNSQATLPSIPMITDEYEPPIGVDSGAYNYNSNPANLSTSSASSNSSHNNSGQEYQFHPQAQNDKELQQQSHQSNQKRKQHQIRHSPLHTPQQHQQQHQQQQQHQHNEHNNQQAQQHQQNNRLYTNGSGNTYMNHSNMRGGTNNNHSVINMSHNLSNQNMDYNSGTESPHDIASESLAMAAAALEQQIGVLSSSSSSSESDSSGSESGTDSDDSTEEDSATAPPQHPQHQHHQHHQQQQQQQQHEVHSQQQHHFKMNMNQLPNLGLGLSQSPSPPSSTLYPHHQAHLHDQTNFTTNGAYPDLLHNDLQLSNSSDDDD